ncbi:pyridoxamine 5'-phosphate oxidase family protein [Orrella daihaiensis]|uniref:Pyridoxamine 5'-phosphate oxidase family protein n=1 Tax=Orrella daihaiensis TaxID=2782176 RepID=A0ABY4AIX6_9BURK|nr:pyridoxamine 5'-phosphate oxidase family protein [Orrella daihaiensis]UOD50033.1 pyridoxamine 5'-phosphate oxidase family protein [Orrella daihaiensis]
MRPTYHLPEEIQQQIWKELLRATHDRHHGWRTPVLATASANGIVNARTVVLRRAKQVEGGGMLEIYTDRRSAKVAELVEQSSACLVFWSAKLQWQLRVRADMSIQTDGPYVESLWQIVKQTRAASDYLGYLPPGEPMPEIKSSDATDKPNIDDAALSDENEPENYFAVLTAQIKEMDWLELGLGRHRRARFAAGQCQWLCP